MVKRLLALMLALMCILLCACTEKAPPETQPTETTAPTEPTLPPVSLKVGVCLPGNETDWGDQGALLAASLEDIGHTALVRYSGSAQTQKQQLQQLLEEPVDCIVLAAVDALALTDTLKQAKNQNIPVVALDRMLVYSNVAAVCVAMDSFAAGQQLAHYIIKNTRPSPEAPKTIEFFMGSPEDHGAVLLHRGLMEILKPFLDSGSLICKSKRISFEDTCTLGDQLEMGKLHFDEVLALSGYKKTRPDIICCATDTLAEGCILSLEENEKRIGEVRPLIASVGASPEAVKRIVEGRQTVSIYCDPAALIRECVELADLLLAGKPLPMLPEENTGMGQVRCLWVAPVTVDAGNFRQVTVEEGSYSLWQVLPEGYVEPEPTQPEAEVPADPTKPEQEADPTKPTEATDPTKPTETIAPTQATTPTETTAPAKA